MREGGGLRRSGHQLKKSSDILSNFSLSGFYLGSCDHVVTSFLGTSSKYGRCRFARNDHHLLFPVHPTR
jgi:hypothetical protein